MYAHISKYLRISKYSLPIKVYAHILKYLRIPKIFASNQIFAPSKYSLTSKIFAPYLKYLRICKIYAPQQECSRLIIYDRIPTVVFIHTLLIVQSLNIFEIKFCQICLKLLFQGEKQSCSVGVPWTNEIFYYAIGTSSLL